MKKAIRAPKNTGTSKRVTFQIAATPNSTVFLAGSFNDWNPKKHQMKDPKGIGKYSITLVLPKGDHEYKYVVNGNWVIDPECQNWVRNSYGTLNSVVKVK